MKKLLALVLVLGCVWGGDWAFGKGGSSYSGGSKSSSFSSGSKSSSSKPSSSWGSSKPSSKPAASSWSKPASSSKPSTSSKPVSSSFDSSASKSKARDESRISYEKSHPKYVAPNGKAVEVKSSAPTTQTVRSLPPERVKNHTVIVEKHYHDYYGPRYDYYRSQPYVSLGGGYNTLFWYAMMDWSLDRQARWYYNHEQQFLSGELNRDLYSERLKNDKLKQEIEKLRAQKAAQDPNYVDDEFKDAPEAMLDPEFVKAASQEESSSGWFWVGGGIVVACFLMGL